MKRFWFLPFLLVLGCHSKPKFEHPDAVACDTVRVANAITLYGTDSITGKYGVIGHADTFYIVERDKFGRIVNQTVVDHWPLDTTEKK
jgi:hypothetical protein